MDWRREDDITDRRWMMGNPDWATPGFFFDRCVAAWGPFDLDAAASEVNSKCRKWLGPGSLLGEDALEVDWLRAIGGENQLYPSVFVNPPYWNLAAWVSKAIEESDKGLTVVMLLPWGQWAEWMEAISGRSEMVRVVGRIKFVDPTGAARTQPNGMNVVGVVRPPVEGVRWPVGFTGAEIKGTP